MKEKRHSYPVEERNYQLLSFFLKLGFNAKIIGNPNQPKIIIDNSYAISGFVRNREYNFTTKPFHGSIIKTINLFNTNISRTEVDQLVAISEKRKIWKVCKADDSFEDEPQYYTKTVNGVTHFAKDDARFFFDEDSAISCQQYLTEKENALFCVVSS